MVDPFLFRQGRIIIVGVWHGGSAMANRLDPWRLIVELGDLPGQRLVPACRHEVDLGAPLAFHWITRHANDFAAALRGQLGDLDRFVHVSYFEKTLGLP